MNPITKIVATFQDGTTQELDVTIASGVSEAEVEKLEGEVAAVDAELKADETPASAATE